MGKQGRLRIIFNQQIIRKADDKLMVNARITAVLTKNSRPILPDILMAKFEGAGIKMEEV
jgi:acyl-CoA thioester hydrolase